MIPQSASTPTPSTYIGIAFYTLKGFPSQWVIVLSSCHKFSRDLLCGTIIDGVGGFVESWRRCHTLASFSPQCYFSGTVMVGEAKQSASNIKETISSLRWRPVEARAFGLKLHYPPSDEYVCRVLGHLDNANIICLPPNAKNDIDNHIRDHLRRLHGPDMDQRSIIPI